MREKPRTLGTDKNLRMPPRTPGSTEVIYGRNAVLETVRTGSRTIHEILVLPQHEAEILDTAGPVAVRVLQRRDMERIAGTEHHQGMAARVSLYRYAGLDELFRYRVVVLLDSVEDPQNLGSIVRTAHALAGAGMVIPEHRAAGVTPAVVKASSGATEHVKIARVTNLRAAAQKLKENGFWLVGLEADAREDIGSIPKFDKVGLVLGGEDSGIRPVVTSELDMAARIPMQGTFNSLNVAHAAAIALYELAVRGR
ncbi:MAG TPA: 23S rRNA (guanosine(2251)-2'-O)-methyltransferase RlmB [Deltaproteobacteria bacterium]|nr:23S rRNA (guanosine(2251)-2'-O)-methyltransferase RlmB [Deltaproteobacteria bacterium]HQI81278.1 23S rRNA (guanosine(2251)-2'-O)-methyltransferase RlmB [Deltaproteobacteria bacterium]